MRKSENLRKEEEKALIAFADRFTTCTLNPDMAAKMIDKTTSHSEGTKIVQIAEETQKHHHTKTCKKNGPKCRFGMPRYPIWRTMLSKTVNCETIEEWRERSKKHKEILVAVDEVLENEEIVETIMNEIGNKKNESKKEYIVNRKKRILKVLEIAKVGVKSYLAAVREQTKKGVSVILARDIDELYINNYNPEWLRAWNANMDIQLCFDFFAVITYITEYFTKDESGTSAFLKLAAKNIKELGHIEQKRQLKNVFLTHRQIGISEAFMKILPEMRFKDSNIGTEFLPLGKREDMSRYIVRADEEYAYNNALFEIPEREGLYYEKPNWIDKYFRRGKTLEDITPSHIVKMYDSARYIKENSDKTSDDNDQKNDDELNDAEADTVKKHGKEAKYHHFITKTGHPGKILPQVVELENPCPREPRYLKKRKHPKALRFFKVKQEDNAVRFFLQELMLYTSFDEKTYNDWHDDEKCIEAYLKAAEDIKCVKNQIMEWLEDVEEGRYYVEECLKNQVDTSEVGDNLDAETERDVLDCEEEGNETDPLYEHLDLGNHNESEFTQSSKWCKTIELKDEDQLNKEAQNLDRFQRKTLDIGLKYARDVVKARQSKNVLAEAPNLIVIGGAGSGKSTVISSITQWVHKTLQAPGDDPQSPYIIPTATTGAASVIIEGTTLHSALGFDYSHKHSSLSDKKREEMRERFKNVKFIIVDEFSMMKVELLYRLDLRMKELKINNRPFGGVSVYLMGDPAQLKPVLGRFIFDKSNSEEYQLAYGDGSESL